MPTPRPVINNSGCNQRNLQLRSFSSYLFKKKYRFPLCAACNIEMTLGHSANKNWGIVRLIIRASFSYQSPAIPGGNPATTTFRNINLTQHKRIIHKFGINIFRKIIRRTYRGGFLIFVLGSEKLHILWKTVKKVPTYIDILRKKWCFLGT